MTMEIRPEFLDTDDDEWFFKSGEVPQILGVSSGTVYDLLRHAGTLDAGSMDNAGCVDATALLVGIENELCRAAGDYRNRLGEAREVAIWARDHGRRVEWC